MKLEKVLRLEHTKKEKKKFVIEMKEINKNAEEIQKKETEFNKKRLLNRTKYDLLVKNN